MLAYEKKMNNNVYIVDLYNPYRDKNIKETFRIND